MMIIKNLIAAMIDYAMDNNWSDSGAIDALGGCGITKQEFIDCGYGDFVKDYFMD